MKSKRIQGALLALSIGLFSAGSAHAAVISLVSGNGAVGSLDSQVHMLLGPTSGPFAAAFTQTDFANAAAGSAATVIAPNVNWAPSLAGYSTAQWVSTNANGGVPMGVGGPGANTALYAISFTLGAVSSAVLDFTLNADNFIGSNINQGVFLNGVAIPLTTSPAAQTTVFSMTGVNVLSSLVVGTNTLYFNVTNQNVNNANPSPSGLLFGATLTTTNIPTPGTISLVAVGLLLLLMFAFKRDFFVAAAKR